MCGAESFCEIMMSLRKVVFLIFVSGLTAVSSAAGEDPAFSMWKGKWEGDVSVYSATGDCLETLKVTLLSEPSKKYAKGLQKLAIMSQGVKRTSPKQVGFFLIDAMGLRRILKTEDGDPVSDLRGRVIGPGKIYWYDIDTDGVLREVCIETIDGDVATVQGFRWDGQRSGSYRIIEGKYHRK